MKTHLLMAVFLVVLSSCSLFSVLEQNEKEDTFSLTYHDNGAEAGAVPIDSSSYKEEQDVQIKSPGSLNRSGYSFVEWNRKADGTGTGNEPDTWLIMPDYDVTLFAIWEAAE